MLELLLWSGSAASRRHPLAPADSGVNDDDGGVKVLPELRQCVYRLSTRVASYANQHDGSGRNLHEEVMQ